MRREIAEAEVGDEQRGEDPPSTGFRAGGDLLGKEAALFLPSGTMCNAIAFRLHCQPGGDEVLLDAPPIPAMPRRADRRRCRARCVPALDGARGIFTPRTLHDAVRPDTATRRGRGSSRSSRPRTWRRAIWPLTTVAPSCWVAQAARAGPHLDGARLINAVVATDVLSAR